MTDSERIAELERIVTEFQAVIGDYHDRADMANRPAELPNGEYPILFRQRQLGLGIDQAVSEVEALGSRVAALEARPASSTLSGDVRDQLAAYNVHIRQNKLTVGMLPDEDDPSALQIGGDAAATILGLSNAYADGSPRGTDGQNPGEAHKSTLVVSDNDGGMRLRQYFQWKRVDGAIKRVRNTTNRPAGILALDSRNDLCASRNEVGSESDGGQAWYMRIIGLYAQLCTYKPGGEVHILESTTYGATDRQKL